MREALNHWDFVIAAYAISGVALALLIGWSWQAMRKAEAKRDELKRR
jgi:heme exporter protein CcmD